VNKKTFYIAVLFFLNVINLCAQQVSSFNNKSVQVDSTGDYKFIISGHFYGDGTNKSGYPANTLLANLDWINESDACMLICLGDLFMDISNDMPKYKSSFFDKLEIPLFNAVGNHDITGSVYQENYGATFFKFQIGNDIHVILDTEINGGDLESDQLKMLSEIESQCKSEKINNVFFYAHRTIWKDTYSELDGLFQDNTQSITAVNYKSEVLPIVSGIAKKTNVFWFAGSLGDAPASFFYFKDEQNKITYIATAIRALLRDAVLIAEVKSGIVSFTTHSFTNQPVESLEYYDSAYWKKTPAAEPFNYRLIPLYLKNIVMNSVFWYGIAFALVVFGAIWYIRKRRRR
jgi:hypothetical protein